jgi:glycerol-1-phosphate dehydrogenase [NAD(P)+]
MTATPQVPFDLAAVRSELAGGPDAGRLAPLGMGRVIDGDGALAGLADAVAELRRSSGAVVVLAAATPMSVAGRELRSVVQDALRRGFPVEWVTVGPPAGGEPLHADAPTVAAAAAAVASAGCVVTVGSGTITDIGKAATPAGLPLVAVQTATSVNGYADPFSVLLRDGVKRTTPSRWPDTLVIDPAVLRAAPPELNRAGVGDLMAMFTCSADWYLASVIRTGAGPGYHAAVTGLTRAHGGSLLALAAGLDTDPGALTGLARILTLSGIGMGVAGSTAPASGMEHAISHLLEMAAAARGDRGSLHGTQVGVGSVVAAATWAHVRRAITGGALDRAARLPDPDDVRDHITRSFALLDPGGAMAAECFADYARKLSALRGAGDPLAGLRRSWAEHEAVLDTLLAGPGEVAAGLRSAGLPASFGELPEPVSDAEARWAVASCRLMRQRLSVADLAALIGCWQDDDVDEVLAAATAAAAAAADVAAPTAPAADAGQP